MNCFLGGERSALWAEAETTPRARLQGGDLNLVSHTLEHWFPFCAQGTEPPPPNQLLSQDCSQGQIIHVHKQLWSELLSKENVKTRATGAASRENG